ncbi:ABC transporter substrate-binding protein, partial [Bifidobacterium breve]
MGYINGVYEPLGVVDLVDPSRDVKPWLASKIEWSEDYKSVTFTARDGVTWSDGKKFSADDIAYTFKMFMDVPGLDVQNLGITGVQEDGSTVTLNFKESMYTKQDKVLHKLIVPKHIWEGVKDPKTFKNEDMVGTGPYTKKQYTSESVVLTARKDYWGGEVAAKTLYFVSYNDNTA